LARRLQRRLLTVAMTDDTVWGWLGSTRRSERADRPDHACAQLAGSTRFALGEPGWGVAGFRDSHEQSLAAHRVAAHFPQRVTRYDDVALESVLLYDTRAARRFAERELGPLAAPDTKIQTLRDTLYSYLQCGFNAAATAAAIDVSDRTVAYRIHGVELLLGHSILARGTELAAAVRLHRILEQRSDQ
jgi:sugar diacid utilization regulator